MSVSLFDGNKLRCIFMNKQFMFIDLLIKDSGLGITRRCAVWCPRSYMTTWHIDSLKKSQYNNLNRFKFLFMLRLTRITTAHRWTLRRHGIGIGAFFGVCSFWTRTSSADDSTRRWSAADEEWGFWGETNSINGKDLFVQNQRTIKEIVSTGTSYDCICSSTFRQGLHFVNWKNGPCHVFVGWTN